MQEIAANRLEVLANIKGAAISCIATALHPTSSEKYDILELTLEDLGS
jgi:hypothetical protein